VLQQKRIASPAVLGSKPKVYLPSARNLVNAKLAVNAKTNLLTPKASWSYPSWNAKKKREQGYASLPEDGAAPRLDYIEQNGVIQAEAGVTNSQTHH